MKNTDRNKELLLEQLRKTPIAQIAVDKIGIDRSTFHRWKKDDPEFSRQVEEAISAGRFLINDLAESQLIGAIKDRNLPAVLYWLRAHHPTYKPTALQSGFAIGQDDDQNIYFELFGQLRPENQKLIEPYLKELNKNNHGKKDGS